jgi:hypothetical protein
VHLDTDDCIILVVVVEEPAAPDLVRRLGVGERSEREDHAYEQDHERHANAHLNVLATLVSLICQRLTAAPCLTRLPDPAVAPAAGGSGA